jgi:succinylglutamate desuccinylase
VDAVGTRIQNYHMLPSTYMDGVVRRDGSKPGKTVAIIGGVHGNEAVGMEVLRWAQETIQPECGTVYFIEGNPEAVKKNMRFLEKNLNRCFIKDLVGDSLEEVRARTLMPILDKCEVSLDIHASNSLEATPFVICEDAGLGFAHLIDFPIISSGWDALEPGGTDSYMNAQGKIGLTIECGSIHHPEVTLPLAKEALLQFLRYTNNIEGEPSRTSVEQRHIHVHTVGHKDERDVIFSRDYADFEALRPGEIFAKQGDTDHVAGSGDCIIFPRPNVVNGAEIFILGKDH